MMYVVYYSDSGAAFSIGSILADPMPPQFSVYTCEDDEGVGLLDGTLVWDAATRTVIPAPLYPDDEGADEASTV